MTALDEQLRAHAADRPEAAALTDGRGALGWAALDAAVDAWVRALLAAGARPGEPVALWLPKGRAVLLAHLACLRLGAVSLPVNPRASAPELAHVLADARPPLVLHAREARTTLAAAVSAAARDPARLVVGPHDDAPDATRAPRRRPGAGGAVDDEAPRAAGTGTARAPSPGDDAALIYTSGTTGRPKGARLTHGQLDAQTASLLEAWEIGPDDRLLHVLPLFHVHGLFVAAHSLLAAGGTIALRERFDAADTWRSLTGGEVTLLMAVPTIHQRLLASAPGPGARPAVRLVTSGSAPLPPTTMTRLGEVFGQPPLERYGLTEAGMVSGNPLHGERRPGSVGFDLPGVTTRLVDLATGAPVPDGDEGEVQVRSASVFGGYLNQPEASAEAFTDDGWLRTGDVGRRGAAGDLVLSGRIKELILVGGFNVYPVEIEEALAGHPDVAELAAFGLPDDDLGEVPALAVVPAPGALPHPLPDALLSLCRERLAAYKVPRRVALVDALPRNAMGKLQRGLLPAVSGLG